jgi:hypothetical protein
MQNATRPQIKQMKDIKFSLFHKEGLFVETSSTPLQIKHNKKPNMSITKVLQL